MSKLHWFFDYEQKEWRIVAENAEAAKQAMANLIGKPYEELTAAKKVYFNRCETPDGKVVFKAPTA